MKWRRMSKEELVTLKVLIEKKQPHHLQFELCREGPGRSLFSFAGTPAFGSLFHGFHSFHLHKEIHFGVSPLFSSIFVSRSGD